MTMTRNDFIDFSRNQPRDADIELYDMIAALTVRVEKAEADLEAAELALATLLGDGETPATDPAPAEEPAA